MSCLLWKYISWRGLKRKSVNWKNKRQIRKFCNIFENGKVLGLCSPCGCAFPSPAPRAILRACCARFAPLPTVPVPAASCKRACPLLHERKRPAFAGRANVRDPVGIVLALRLCIPFPCATGDLACYSDTPGCA